MNSSFASTSHASLFGDVPFQDSPLPVAPDLFRGPLIVVAARLVAGWMPEQAHPEPVEGSGVTMSPKSKTARLATEREAGRIKPN